MHVCSIHVCIYVGRHTHSHTLTYVHTYIHTHSGLGTGESKDEREKMIGSMLSALPPGKPRLIHGVGAPDEVFTCIFYTVFVSAL